MQQILLLKIYQKVQFQVDLCVYMRFQRKKGLRSLRSLRPLIITLILAPAMHAYPASLLAAHNNLVVLARQVSIQRLYFCISLVPAILYNPGVIFFHT